ncbi:MAG: dephospho-CoA kinase [Chthoniobacteraceae bacterium]
MSVIGITGGIASGKSSLTDRLSQLLKAEVFDADATARELVQSDSGVRLLLQERFGPSAFCADGSVDREWLRERVFADESKRRALEEILHPAIRARWTAKAGAFRASGTGQTAEWLLLDIPLLYEVGAESQCDAVVVVACREETQVERIVARRGLSPEMARKMIASQTSLASKAARAEYVVWNDAPLERLDEQAELFAGYLIRNALWMNNLPR